MHRHDHAGRPPGDRVVDQVGVHPDQQPRRIARVTQVARPESLFHLGGIPQRIEATFPSSLAQSRSYGVRPLLRWFASVRHSVLLANESSPKRLHGRT